MLALKNPHILAAIHESDSRRLESSSCVSKPKLNASSGCVASYSNCSQIRLQGGFLHVAVKSDTCLNVWWIDALGYFPSNKPLSIDIRLHFFPGCHHLSRRVMWVFLSPACIVPDVLLLLSQEWFHAPSPRCANNRMHSIGYLGWGLNGMTHPLGSHIRSESASQLGSAITLDLVYHPAVKSG